MENRRVETGADNGWVSNTARAVFPEDKFDDRFEFVLVHAGPAMFHRGEVALGADLDGASQRFQVLRILPQSHFMNDRPGVDNRRRRTKPAARFFPNEFYSRDDFPIELFIIPESVVYLIDVFQVFRENLVEHADIVSGVCAVISDCAFDAGPDAGPDLFFTDARANKEDVLVLPMLRGNDRDTIGFVKPGQIEEVSLLAELEIGVGIAPDIV